MNFVRLIKAEENGYQNNKIVIERGAAPIKYVVFQKEDGVSYDDGIWLTKHSSLGYFNEAAMFDDIKSAREFAKWVFLDYMDEQEFNNEWGKSIVCKKIHGIVKLEYTV